MITLQPYVPSNLPIAVRIQFFELHMSWLEGGSRASWFGFGNRPVPQSLYD